MKPKLMVDGVTRRLKQLLILKVLPAIPIPPKVEAFFQKLKMCFPIEKFAMI
jgi:hypothetical protein